MTDTQKTTKSPRPKRRWPEWLGYPVAVIIESMFTVMLITFQRNLPLTEFPTPYTISVLAVTYLFGFGPGLFSFALGLALYTTILGSPHMYTPEEWAGIASYTIGAFIGGIGALIIRESAIRIHRLADELAESSEITNSILESIGDPFFALDKDWRFIYINEKASEALKRNPTDIIGKNLWNEIPEIGGTDFDAEFRGSLRDLEPVRFEGFYPPLNKWFEVHAYPTPDRLSVYLHDITEKKLADEILQRYRILSERTRDIVLFVLKRNGRIIEANYAAERAYGYSRDELVNMSLEELRTPAERVSMDEQLAKADKEGALFETVHQRKDGSSFPVEVSTRGANIGKERVFLHIVRDITERKRAEEAVSKATAEVQNAVEREKYISTTLQKALLPGEPQVIPGYKSATLYRPAYAGTEIGGDFYDIFYTEEGRIGVLIGDVSGKGIEAGSLAAATRSTVRAFAYELPSPAEAVMHANSVLYVQQPSSGSFVTVMLVVIDSITGSLRYARCGHTPAVIVRSDGATELLENGELPIGLEKNARYGEWYSRLNRGDKLVVFTDGISEARVDDNLFEIERVVDTLSSNHSLPPDELASKLMDEATNWAGGKLTDDAAIVVIERTDDRSEPPAPHLIQGEGI